MLHALLPIGRLTLGHHFATLSSSEAVVDAAGIFGRYDTKPAFVVAPSSRVVFKEFAIAFAVDFIAIGESWALSEPCWF